MQMLNSYKNVVVTLNNYIKVFENFSPDIQDEVRSALLDDTPIWSYIDICKDDSYKLNQIRLAIREFVPNIELMRGMSGKSINLVRRMFSEGMSLDVLNSYVYKCKLTISNEVLEEILTWTLSGVDTHRVDFSTLDSSLVSLVCLGLKKGYPMWILNRYKGDYSISNEDLRIIMRGMALELDVHPFLITKWDRNTMTLIFSNAERVDYSGLMRQINEKFSYAQVKEIINVAKSGLEYRHLCLKDSTDGSPMFNEYQMSVLGTVLESDVDITPYLNPKLSDIVMEEMLQIELDKRRKNGERKLSGKLPKPKA